MTTETTETHRDGSITAGLTTGIIGTALGTLNTLGGCNGNPLGALFGGGGCKSNYVTKEEFSMGQELARKDSEIALLKSEYSDEKKMLEIYAELNKQINGVKETVAANRDRADERLFGTYEKLNNKIDYNKSVQDGVNASQLAYNGTNSATIACMQGQIAQLQSMTKTVIPNSSVCPGWGAVNIVPAALSATA